MSEKSRYSEQFDLILRYMNNTMTNEERYKFERELERDPFLYEAFDGLSGLKPSEAERAIRSIDVISGKRHVSFGFLKYVGYVAAAAIVAAGLYWGFMQIDFSGKEVASNNAKNEDVGFMEPYRPAQSDSIDSIASRENVASTDSLLLAANELKTDAILKDNVSAIKEPAKKKQSLQNAAQQVAQKPSEEKEQQPLTDVQSTDEIAVGTEETSASEEEYLPEDIEKPEEALKRPGVNAEPEPLGGSSLFKNYLDNNARYPESADSKRKEIVKIRFRVSKTGDPSNFFIERSPGDAFSQEAIRLIKNGPKWSPQIKDGLPVDGEVSVRITFKP
mgnify:CR=1 FL=1